MLARRFLFVFAGLIVLVIAAAFAYRLMGPQIMRAALVPTAKFTAVAAAILLAAAVEVPAPVELTPREAEVLTLIARGKSNTEIAEELFVSAATVKTHINNLFAKIGVRDRAQAVRYALRHRMD